MKQRIRRKAAAPTRSRKELSAEIGIATTAYSFSAPAKVEREDTSRQADNDITYGIDADAEQGQIIPTPYDLKSIATVYEKSNMLKPCVDCMVVNIASNGYRIVPTVKGGEMDAEEKSLLQSFVDYANPDESLTSINKKMVDFYEKYGFSFVEIIRNGRGVVSMMRHGKSNRIRVCTPSGEVVTVTNTVERGGKRSRVRENKRFRKYVEQVGGRKIYYKEFGDPRRLSFITGKYDTPDHPVGVEDEATELLHDRQFSEDAYGIPRWISQLPNILGSRESEEVNLRYFEDNTVPPLILTVAGGRLTRSSYQEVKQLIEQQGVGKDRQHKMLLIEAVPATTDIDGKGSVQLKIDKLTDTRQGDGLFRDYDVSNRDKIRGAFRLPPVLVGQSQDVTFATANVSVHMAETQVFAPERRGHDEFWNIRLVNNPRGLNLRTVKLESRGPESTSPEQIVKTLTATNVMGGVTPRSSISAINETFQLDLPQYPEPGADGHQEWMDVPLAIGQKMILAAEQQTGEGDTDRDGEAAKDQDIKDREVEGEINPEPVEHGQE